MKKFALIALMVLGSAQAHASWYQVRCQNVDETVQLNSGHSENSLTLKFVREDGQKVALELGPEYVFKLSEKTVISDVNYTKCLPGSDTGVWMRREISTQKVLIARADGAEIADQGFGYHPDLSEDRKSIKAHLICELEMNNMAFCPQN